MERICVYCGSSPGRDPAYVDAAAAFGEALVARDVGLVYGGGHVGMMGAVADAVLDASGEAIGVIPEALADREQAHTGLTDLEVVGSMHERKRRMVDLAEGFAALPGGLGTAEEIFEVLTWAQLGIHDHPCGFLNVAGYYDDLTAYLDHATDEEFVRPEHRRIIHVESDAEALLDAFEAYDPPAVEKVVGSDET